MLTFQIKYIPYSTHYLLSVQSVHDEFKSDFETIHVKTDDIGDHIDQSPKLNETTNSTFIFTVPKLDTRLNATVLTVIVQDYDEKKQLNRTALGLELHEYNFCNAFGDTWIAKIIQVINKCTVQYQLTYLNYFCSSIKNIKILLLVMELRNIRRN